MHRILVVCSSFLFSDWKYMFVDSLLLLYIRYCTCCIEMTLLKILYRFVHTHCAAPSKLIFARVFCRIYLACLTERLRYTSACTIRHGTRVSKLFCRIWQVKRKQCAKEHYEQHVHLKVLSHQIRSAWKWFGWIGLDQYKDRGWLKDFLILLPFANLNFSSHSGIAKRDRCCMQFADTAGKFACGARFCIFESFKSLFCISSSKWAK